MTAARGDRKSSRGVVWLVVALAAMGSCVICIGLGAAVAIPGFITYVRRAKTAEARANVAAIARSVVVEHEASRWELGRGRLPDACPRTPLTIGDARQVWPASADPSWRALGWEPYDPIYYAYEYVPDADGLGFVVRAYGDLDADGVESVFEQRGRIDPSSGDVVLTPIAVTNELE